MYSPISFPFLLVLSLIPSSDELYPGLLHHSAIPVFCGYGFSSFASFSCLSQALFDMFIGHLPCLEALRRPRPLSCMSARARFDLLRLVFARARSYGSPDMHSAIRFFFLFYSSSSVLPFPPLLRFQNATELYFLILPDRVLCCMAFVRMAAASRPPSAWNRSLAWWSAQTLSVRIACLFLFLSSQTAYSYAVTLRHGMK